jgi:hypothetical protein
MRVHSSGHILNKSDTIAERHILPAGINFCIHGAGVHAIERSIRYYGRNVVPWVIPSAGVCEDIAIGSGVIVSAVFFGTCIGKGEVCDFVW